MISIETLVFILYIVITFCVGIIMGLLDSRNFWRKKWEEAIKDENIRSTR